MMTNKHSRTPDAVRIDWIRLSLENETTVSFFNKAAYDEFKANPEEKWM